MFAAWLGFWGLLGLPTLGLIYYFRRQFRPQTVSSLLFWQSQQRLREGGQRWDRIQLPLLILLEILLILLLTLAAANPQFLLADREQAFVILDDSFSMWAEAPDGTGKRSSSRQRGLEALQKLQRAEPNLRLRWILAGETIRLLGETNSSTGNLADELRDWQCQAPVARINDSIAFVKELGGVHARILVLTDHAPYLPNAAPESTTPATTETTTTATAAGPASVSWVAAQGTLRWWSVGQPQANGALVHALRRASPRGDLCLVEVANYSQQLLNTELTVSLVTNPDALGSVFETDAAQPATESAEPVLQRRELTLAAGERLPVRLQFPASASADLQDRILRVQLRPDALNPDNTALLVPESDPKLRVRLDGPATLVGAGTPTAKAVTALTEAIRAALSATQRVEWVAQQPHLEIRVEDLTQLLTVVKPTNSTLTDTTTATATPTDTDTPTATATATDDSATTGGPTQATIAPVVQASATPAESATADDVGTAWQVHVLIESATVPYVGPFVVDRIHPLCKGLALDQLLWSAGTSAIPGQPVLSAGNLPLVTDTIQPNNRHLLRLRLNPESAPLLQQPIWPALWWNLVDWRLQALPGLEEANVRLGTTTRYSADLKTQQVRIRTPTGEERAVPVVSDQGQRQVVLQTERPGLYRLQPEPGKNTLWLSANLLAPGESNLQNCITKEWGQWSGTDQAQWRRQSLSRFFLLPALILLLLHTWLATPRRVHSNPLSQVGAKTR